MIRVAPATRELRRARLAVAVTFLVHAAVFATWAPRIPSIKADLDLSHDDLGFALGGLAVGLLVGTRLTGRMEKRGRTDFAIRVLVPLQAVALVVPAYCTNLGTLTAALAVLGLFGGMLDVLMNAHAVAVERLYGRPVMSGFHGLWSVGSMGGSVVAAFVARAGVGVGPHFAVVAVVVAIGSAPFLAGLLSSDREAATTGHQAEGTRPAGPPVGVLVVTLLALMGFGSFLAEGTVYDWSAVFLAEDRGTSVGFAALGLSVFSGAMAASRLVADRVGLRLGPVLLSRIGAGMGVVGFAVLLLVPSPVVALVGLAVAGLGIGPVVPVVFSAAGNTPTRRRPSFLGPVVSAGYVGAVVGPVVIGALAERVGLPWALVVPVGFCAVILGAAGLLSRASGGPSSDEVAARAHGPAHADG